MLFQALPHLVKTNKVPLTICVKDLLPESLSKYMVIIVQWLLFLCNSLLRFSQPKYALCGFQQDWVVAISFIGWYRCFFTGVFWKVLCISHRRSVHLYETARSMTHAGVNNLRMRPSWFSKKLKGPFWQPMTHSLQRRVLVQLWCVRDHFSI